MSKFPDNFLFGGAISACQAEGAWNEGGKSLTFPEIVKRVKKEDRTDFHKTTTITEKDIIEGKTGNPDNYPKRRGIDFFHSYKEDIRLLAEMGLRCFRFSISMARIFPNLTDEEPNEQALLVYDDIIREIRKNGMEPLVTMAHFDPPIAVYEKYGGYCNREMIDIFYRYSKVLLDRYHDEVKYWLPFNELNVGLNASFKALGIPYAEDEKYEQRKFQGLHNQMVASAKTVIYAHENYPDLQIGSMITHSLKYPYSPDPKDVIATDNYDHFRNYFFLDVTSYGYYPYYTIKYFKDHGIILDDCIEDYEILKKGTVDWIGFSYYNTSCVAFNDEGLDYSAGNYSRGVKNPKLGKDNGWGWQFDSLGFRISCNRLYDRYRKPLFILENGTGFEETMDEECRIHDPYRSDYLKMHLRSLRDAIDDGCQIIGYCWWGVIDLISSSTSEMSKRYGFIYVDQDDDGNGSKKRYLKDSYFEYQHIIRTNGEEL